jgi:hypothetical protein
MEPATKRKIIRFLRDVGITVVFGILTTFNVLFSRGENQAVLEEYYMRMTRPRKAEKILMLKSRSTTQIKV